MRYASLIVVGLFALSGCSSSDASSSSTGGLTDEQYKANATSGMHDALLTDIVAMKKAAQDLQSEAPDHAWDATGDKDAIDKMRGSWIEARAAYEHIEGALAPLFPQIDFSIDARYDDFMTDLAPNGDDDLFDDAGVTGMHAIERIIYSDVIPKRVSDFEASLPGYQPARFPMSDVEATSFKTKLCAKFISDAQKLEDQWTPTNIDVAIAFQGLISLVNEQREKVQKASSNEEESRYSQRTMVDLRDNLLGTRTVYGLFKPWIDAKHDADATKDGPTINGNIDAGLTKLDAAYMMVSGDAIPEPPTTWSAENPTAADLKTPFGVLYTQVNAAVDPADGGSIVSQMNDAATVLGFPQFPTGK